MSSVASREIDRALLKKGFVRENSKDRVYRLWAEGRPTGVKTILSHTSSMDYDDHLLAQMAKQMRLTKRELLQFVQCTMSGDKYADLMIERGWVAGR